MTMAVCTGLAHRPSATALSTRTRGNTTPEDEALR